MSSFITSTSLSSKQNINLPENIINLYFPSFLSYPSTLTLFNELTATLKQHSNNTHTNSSMLNEINTSSIGKSNINSISSSSSSCLNSIVNHSTNYYAYLNDNQPILPFDNHIHNTTTNNNNNNNESRTTDDNIKYYSKKFENFSNLFKSSSISESVLNPVQRSPALTKQYDSYFLKNQYRQFSTNPTQSINNNNNNLYSSIENSSINLETRKLKDIIVKSNKKNITNKILYEKMNLINKTINDHETIVNKELNQPPITLETTVIDESLNKPNHQLYSQRKCHKSIETTMNDDEIQEQSKRYRTSYSERQIELLEKTYQLDRYINRPQRAKLSIELNLPENTIKVWFQNRRMKEKRQALMLPTVAGKDPYLRETLLRVTQLYCATRYGCEYKSPITGMTKFQSKAAQGKHLHSEIRGRKRTSSTSITITDPSSDINGYDNTRPDSLSKKLYNKGLPLINNPINNCRHDIIHKENGDKQLSIHYSKSPIQITNNQYLSKEYEDKIVSSCISNDYSETKFLTNTKPSNNNIVDRNVDFNKRTTIFHPLNLSTSSLSSDENHSVFEYPPHHTTQNVFSTFPFIHSTSLAILEKFNEPVMSSSNLSLIN
ncbi:hypothetical protein MN116_007390 [Schistosoma mekongi]|uniref:Homeobox domain-containing protein n=1 Tax=Schistosoma mekongi TaxID=38744 RepID=A0AAE2D394_SCHME|nr:hypothetical protein MN116_007390 [Schistosoma mekongi]